MDLGQNITVDGIVGAKTIAALNAVQSVFGLEKTEMLDAAGYGKLLPGLLLSIDPEKGKEVLGVTMEDPEMDYLCACAHFAKEEYVTAKSLFEASKWNDWEARSASCIQAWPETGVLYHNYDIPNGSTELTVQYNSTSGYAILVKIYTRDNVLARTMFIAGNGQATTSLPAGVYRIEDGRGKDWYGEKQAFGSDGNYEVMTFENGDTEVELPEYSSSTITVNTQEYVPDSDRVGSKSVNWGDF